jgi:hypothetical protein
MQVKDDVLLYYVKKFLREDAVATIVKEKKRLSNTRAAKNIQKARARLDLLNKIK